jgi:phage protein U
MEQYGFVVPGNPWDRVSFQGLELPAAHGGRRLLSHSAVRAAAAAIADKLKEQQQKQQQQLEVVAGGQPANCSKGGGASDDCQEQLVRVQCACASVLAAAGWRRKADYEAVTEDTTRRVVQVLLGWVEQRQAVQAGEYDVAGSGALHPSTEAAGCSAASDRLEAAAQYVRERAALLQATQHLLQQVVKV